MGHPNNPEQEKKGNQDKNVRTTKLRFNGTMSVSLSNEAKSPSAGEKMTLQLTDASQS